MSDLHEGVLSMVKRRLQQNKWRVTTIYRKAAEMSGEINSMSVERFRDLYIVPVLNGPEEKDSEPRDIDIPGSLRPGIEEKEEDVDSKEGYEHPCPKDTCSGGSISRAGLARHIDASHPDETGELRKAVGLDPDKAAKTTKDRKRREPLILSEEDQEQLLALIQEETPAAPALPPKEGVRQVLLQFAEEVRDTADPLEVVNSLETCVDMIYDLFAGEEG